MKYAIENEYLKVEATSMGGCLSSIFDKSSQDEALYQPEEDSWQGQDVAIFPFVARLKGKTYTHEGKTYSLRNHGICRYYEFKVVDKKPDEMTLELESNDETLKEYPFAFRFAIRYSLEGKTLHVRYSVTNESEKDMPFGIGAHPAFKLIGVKDGGKTETSGNALCFDKPTYLTRICFDEKGEMVKGEEDYGVFESIDIRKQLFVDYQTLCVKGDGISDVCLKRKDGKVLRFHYDNIVYLVLWSFLEAGSFVAIEPWMSLPDYDDAPKELSQKKTLLKIAPKETYYFSYSVSLE